MKKTPIITKAKEVLEEQKEIIFAYLHGSVLHSENPNDVDIGLFLERDYFRFLYDGGEVNLGFLIPLERKLQHALHETVDLQVLNKAPLAFKYRVISTGRVIVDKKPDLRAEFEYLYRVEYFDFKPRHEEYLMEALKP
jgi:hypothetical protein